MKMQRRAGTSTTKADLVDLVYRTHGGLTKHEATEVVESILRHMKTNLLAGKSVKIHNFGVFEVVPRRGRVGVDPASGERIFIPARRGLAFRPANRLKRELAPGDDER